MEAIVEIVLQLILEILVQVAGESLFESGLYGVRQVFKRAPASPAAAASRLPGFWGNRGGIESLDIPEALYRRRMGALGQSGLESYRCRRGNDGNRSPTPTIGANVRQSRYVPECISLCVRHGSRSPGLGPLTQ